MPTLLLTGAGPSSPWFPSTVSGYVNSPYSFAELRATGNLWQNAAKTTPAVADGDLVRVATVAPGVDWTAPADANRPTLKNTAGSRWALRFGNTHTLASPTGTAGSGSTGLTVCWRGTAPPGGTAWPLVQKFDNYGTQASWIIRADTGADKPQFIITSNGGGTDYSVLASGTWTVGADVTVVAYYDPAVAVGSRIGVSRDGGSSFATGSAAGAPFVGTSAIRIGGTSPNPGASIDVYGCPVYGERLSAADIALIAAYLAAL